MNFRIYFEVIKELTKEEHLLDMVIPMCVEKDLINKIKIKIAFCL